MSKNKRERERTTLKLLRAALKHCTGAELEHKRVLTSSGVEHTFNIWRFARWQLKVSWWKAG